MARKPAFAFICLFAALLLAGCAEMQAMGGTNVLVKLLTGQLGVTSDQAMGGVGSILSLVKEKLPSMDFTTLSKFIPGADGFLTAAKDLGAVAGPIGDKAGLSAAFSRLGMGSDMVGKFTQVLSDFVGKAGGETAKNLLAAGLK